MRYISKFHPIILIWYFGMMMIFTMSTLHIGMLVLSTILAIILLLFMYGIKVVFKKYILMVLPMFLLIVFVNGAFNHYGVTSLYMLNNGNSITLECIFFGLVMGFMVVGVLFWFLALNSIICTDDILYLLGKILPGISLIVSMSLRFIPLYKKNLKEIRNNARTLGKYNNKSLWGKIKCGYSNYSILFSRCLEESVETAGSMQNRGFGVNMRSNYHNYHFGRREIRQAFFLFVCTVIIMYGYVKGYCYANYNPYITIKSKVWMFIAFALMGIFPIVETLIEEKQYAGI